MDHARRAHEWRKSLVKAGIRLSGDTEASTAKFFNLERSRSARPFFDAILNRILASGGDILTRKKDNLS